MYSFIVIVKHGLYKTHLNRDLKILHVWIIPQSTEIRKAKPKQGIMDYIASLHNKQD